MLTSLGSSVVEQPPCKRQVGGSNPFPGSTGAALKSRWRLLLYPGVSGRGTLGVPGGVPERPKGADCKSAGFAYGGSNPPAPTQTEYAPVAQSVEHFHGKEGVSGSSPLGGSGIGVYSVYDIGVAV